MRSHTLYLAILAVTCIVLQEVSASKKNPIARSVPENYEEDDMSKENTMEDEDIEEEEIIEEEHHDCTEYKSKIWDNAFSNPMAMRLAEVTFDTVSEMASDDTCLDTIRSFIRFIEVLSTDPHAHYTARMLHKLVGTALHRLDTDSNKFQETKRVIDRILIDQSIQNLIISFFNNSINLFKDPVVRNRFFLMLEKFGTALLPTKNELYVKEKMRQVKGLVSSPLNKFKGVLGNIM